jgi:hypothetical protein
MYTTSTSINEMDEACSMCMREEWCMKLYGGGKLWEKGNLKDLCVDGGQC